VKCVEYDKDRVEAGNPFVYVKPRRKIASDPEVAGTALKGTEPGGAIDYNEVKSQALLKL
jgi:hypothetical protein